MLMYLNCDVPTEVSDEDFNFLSGLMFQVSGYGYLRCSSKPCRGEFLHIIVAKRMKLKFKDRVDHRDCDKLNNRRSNLRASTFSENIANAKLHVDNQSGYKGVTSKNGRWSARIRVNYELIDLGLFDSAEEAHCAYVEASERYFGSFANSG